MIDILISPDPLNVHRALTFCENPHSGGIVVFLGTVRNHNLNRNVKALEFEAYESMAIREMQHIAEQVADQWEADSVVIHHRTGLLDIGEAPVLIIVACAHRKEAFEACSWAIDELKRTVPIWKKEILDNGEVWISAHP